MSHESLDGSNLYQVRSSALKENPRLKNPKPKGKYEHHNHHIEYQELDCPRWQPGGSQGGKAEAYNPTARVLSRCDSTHCASHRQLKDSHL